MIALVRDIGAVYLVLIMNRREAAGKAEIRPMLRDMKLNLGGFLGFGRCNS
jgi:hypothetical protein